MAIVPKCARPQSPLFAQITEEARCRIDERDPCGRSANMTDKARNYQTQELFDRTTNLFREFRTRLAAPTGGRACSNPVGNKVLRIRRQVCQSFRSLAAGEFAILDKQRNSVMHCSRCITLLGEVVDIAFD